jgi:hypothetical protein
MYYASFPVSILHRDPLINQSARGVPKSAIEKFAKNCCRFWGFWGHCPGHFIPFVHGNRHLCLPSSHIPNHPEANFLSKEKLPPYSTLENL